MAKKRSFNPEKDLIKKEYFDLENDLKPPKPSPGAKIKETVSGFSQGGLLVLKFIIGLCVLPFVFSSTGAFLAEFENIPPLLQRFFWSGIVFFLLAHLFIWEGASLYSAGQKILTALFSFFTPLVKVAPSLLPIYTILTFAVCGVLSLIMKDPLVTQYCMFFAGFTIALHLVFSAKSVKSKKGDFLKANYIFSFSIIYALNLILLSAFLNMMFRDYSFLHFWTTTYQGAHEVILRVFRQLFVRG